MFSFLFFFWCPALARARNFIKMKSEPAPVVAKFYCWCMLRLLCGGAHCHQGTTHWNCSYTRQSPCSGPARSKAKVHWQIRQGRGEATGVCGVGVRHRDWDGGLGLENEVGYKFCQCCVCEEGCPSGTRRPWRCARVSRVLARARLVIKDAVSSLQRPPTSMPKRQSGTLNCEDFWVGSFFGLAGIEECCCGN